MGQASSLIDLELRIDLEVRVPRAEFASEIPDAGDGPANNQTCEIENSNLKIITDQGEFLSEIHKRFLKCEVVDRGLLDKLREAEAISSEEEDSIANEPQQKQGARKFWYLLHTIPEEDFASIVVPYLQERYPHVMAGLAFKTRENAGTSIFPTVSCLRHSMRKRIRIQELIDILKWTDCCSLEEYRRWMSITSGYCGDEEWQKVFTLLQHNAHNAKLCQDVKALLQQKKIDRPERFPAVASVGFPCTCDSGAALIRVVDKMFRHIYRKARELQYNHDGDFLPFEKYDPDLLAFTKKLENISQQVYDQQQVMMSLEIKCQKQSYTYTTPGGGLLTGLRTVVERHEYLSIKHSYSSKLLTSLRTIFT